MDSSSIELPGSDVDRIFRQGGEIIVEFGKAYIVKTMTGSTDRTLWWQKGRLVLGGVMDPEGEFPEAPLVCAGGDVGENVYTYRDMVPIPLESRGRAHMDLRFVGTDRHVKAAGDRIRLELEGVPKYIRHIGTK